MNNSGYYLPLYKAALKSDWDSARRFFDNDPEAVTSEINPARETTLHVTVRTGRSIYFVKKLLELMPEAALEHKSRVGQTAPFLAAIVGNTEAAKLMVAKNPGLVYISN